MKVSKGLVVLDNVTADACWQSVNAGIRPMFPVANRPLILHAVDGLNQADVRDVAIVADEPAWEAVEPVLASRSDQGMRVTYIPRTKGEGVVWGLLDAIPFIDGGPVVLLSGDCVLGPCLRGAVDAFRARQLDALLLREHDEGDARRRSGNADARFRRAPITDEGLFRGVGIFGPMVARAAEQAARDRERPSFADLVSALGDLRASIATDVVEGWRRCRDGQSLLRATRAALDHLETEPTETSPGPHVEIQGRALIDSTSRLESTTVRGPILIGARTSVSNAFLGPYTSIGDDVVIEGAEIENSTILAGARISHPPKRLEGSIVGRSARVSSEFGMPRCLRLIVGEGAEVLFS